MNICHRDLKPDNLIISSNLDKLFLADFGVAKKCGINEKILGNIAGTLSYMAPELLEKN